MTRITRREVAWAGAFAAFAASQTAAASEKSAASYELTFLKSAEADPARLADFIQRNWFEMDRIAVDLGLMSSYRMLVAQAPDEPWDVLVIVGYPSAGGYADIAPAFEKIRKAHKTVLIDGRGLRDLGAIVASRRLRAP
jgi:methylmalonyl-CoA mutase cobalamin-binding subunit